MTHYFLCQVSGSCSGQGAGGEAGDDPALPRLNSGGMGYSACHSSLEANSWFTDRYPKSLGGYGTLH